MAEYYVTISVLSVLGYSIEKWKPEKRNIILYLVFSGVILTFLSAIRYGIGFDYYSYQSIFQQISSLSWKDAIMIFKKEFLFPIIVKIVSSLGGNYFMLLFLIHLFIHICFLTFIYQHSKLRWLSIYLYITLQFFAHNMNLLRQAMGVCFFLLAYPYLKQRKWVPYVFLILLGGLIHNSAFLFLPFYFILPIRDRKKLYCFSLSIFLVIYFFTDKIVTFLGKVFPLSYYNYANSQYWAGNSWKYAVFPFLYFLFFLFYKKWFERREKKNSIEETEERKTEWSIFLNSAFFTCLNGVLITKHFILERTTIYFLAIALISLPDLAVNHMEIEFQNSHSRWFCFIQRYFLVILILAGSAAYFFFAAKEGFHHVYPYYSLFDRAKG